MLHLGVSFFVYFVVKLLALVILHRNKFKQLQHLITFSQNIVPLLYSVLQVFIRLGLRIFCGNITVSNKTVLHSKGPLLLACNHPNAILDAIIIGSLFKQPVHYLARGDAFKNPLVSKLLTAFKLMPIYRLSEGREYLALNDNTFESCNNILLQGGIVLIFSEGLCVQKWQLQSLKKGTARIAFNAWKEPSITNNFRVQPVSINYHSFTQFGKQIIVHLGDIITKEETLLNANEGEKIQQFNTLVTKRLSNGILVANGNETLVQTLIAKHKQFIHSPATAIADLQQLQTNSQLSTLPKTNTYILLKILLLLPAIIGFTLHVALYFPIKKLVQKLTKGSVYYDSALFGVLIILYPFYYLTAIVLALNFTNIIALQIVVSLMPLWLWLLTSFKKLFH
jgi:1-acyl-sn-glycerol-3-phosphate acyltransferase